MEVVVTQHVLSDISCSNSTILSELQSFVLIASNSSPPHHITTSICGFVDTNRIEEGAVQETRRERVASVEKKVTCLCH